MAVVLASPLVVLPVFSLARGIVGYATGTGVLLVCGFPNMESTNLDPKLRCFRTSSGCRINCSEFLTQTPNNLAMELLTRVFGPMPGAYRGPYPNFDEALRTLQTSSLRFPPSELSRHAAALGLPAGEPLEYLQREISFLDADIAIGAGIFQDEVVVLGREKYLLLVDRRTGRPFARHLFLYSAWMLLANGEFDKAIAGLDHAIEVDPRNPEHFRERGDAYAGKGDTARATADYRKALEVAPADWHGRGAVEWKLPPAKPAGP